MKNLKLKREKSIKRMRVLIMAIIAFIGVASFCNSDAHGTVKALAGSAILATAGAAGIKGEDELLERVKSAAKEAVEKENESLKAELIGIQAKMSKVEGEGEERRKAMAELETEFKAWKEKGGQLTPFANSIKEQLKKQMTEKAKEFGEFKAGTSKGFTLDIDMKAAATMLESTSLNGSNFLPKPEIRPGYIDLVRNKPLIEEYANGGSTNSAVIVYVNKYNAQGTAAVTAEGAQLNLVSAELKTENSEAYLIGAYEKISIQMLADIDFMAAFIEQELKYQVDIEVDDKLISGTGTNEPKGIEVYAVGYTNTMITTSNANDFDAIRAVIGQMAALNFTPTNIFVNPIDGANMDLVKDLYGRPIAKEYKTDDGKVFRIAITESNQIATGFVLVADMTKFWVWNYLPFQIQYGWENDDFRRNLVSVSGIRRVHSYVSLNHLNGFVYDSFVNIKAAIAPAP